MFEQNRPKGALKNIICSLLCQLEPRNGLNSQTFVKKGRIWWTYNSKCLLSPKNIGKN